MCALRGYGALSCRDARLHQFGHGKHACLLHHAGSMLLRRVKGDFQFRGDLPLEQPGDDAILFCKRRAPINRLFRSGCSLVL